MKILIVLKQKKNVETFLATIRALVDRGHTVSLAVQERSDERDDQYREEIDSPRFSVVRCPAHRTDNWAEVAWLVRSLRDCAHYQQADLSGAIKLQERSVHKLREELNVPADNRAVASLLRAIPPQQIQRLETVFALAEQRLPSDALYDSFLRAEAPDVLLLSPLVHFGSAQADFVASAKALGIPVGMLLYSWDNLSTKGCLHRPPDRMFVWNEQQRREARDLHGFPEDRVVVAGAPRFDAFFDLRPRLTRDSFHTPFGLDPTRSTLLYVCSSQFVSAGELAFVRKWLAAVRASASEPLRTCNVIVRPHPDIPLLGDDVPFQEVKLGDLKGAKGFVARPFDDDRAIVLRTSDRAQQGFFECISQSAAVVGLNTSAELEAAIVGTPVFTILAGDEDADGQRSTLHFHYLLQGHGGCVQSAQGLGEHTAQLEAELASPQDRAVIRRFVQDFLRPHGIDRPVSPLLADAIERTFANGLQGEPAPVAAPGDVEPMPDVNSTASDDGDRRTVVPVAVRKYGYTLQVQGPPGTATTRPDRITLEWLNASVGIGDVLYDVDAGIGLYTMIAAKHHGAVVVAFEPGFSAFKDLCDNLRINGCDGSVLPVPVALAHVEGVGELKYPVGMAGESKHTLRPTPWRVRRSLGNEGNFRQPVWTVTLDQAMQRYGLPAPSHLRLGSTSPVAAVLEGATSVLAMPSMKTVCLTLLEDERDAVERRLEPLQWNVTRRESLSRGRTHLVLSKAVVAVQPARSSRS